MSNFVNAIRDIPHAEERSPFETPPAAAPQDEEARLEVRTTVMQPFNSFTRSLHGMTERVSRRPTIARRIPELRSGRMCCWTSLRSVGSFRAARSGAGGPCAQEWRLAATGRCARTERGQQGGI